VSILISSERFRRSRTDNCFFPKFLSSKKRSAEAASAADDSTVSAADLAGLSKNQKKKLLKAKNGEAVPAPAPAAAASPAPKKEEKKEEKKAEKKVSSFRVFLS